jgi:hypothetical protein
MKLFILRPNDSIVGKTKRQGNPWDPSWDKAFGFVIRAKTQERARDMASKNSGLENKAEGLNPWLDPEYSSCIELKSDGPEEEIMRDFMRGREYD